MLWALIALIGLVFFAWSLMAASAEYERAEEEELYW